MLEPLARLLVANGVGYPALAQALKQVFLQAARDELAAEGMKPTDAAISIRSGVHRKDVRALGQAAAPRDNSPAQVQRRRTASVAEQVFTKWTTDSRYQDRAGRPAVLPGLGPAPSFESLVHATTRDMSRRTVLDELLRLGLVRIAGRDVVPVAEAVVPTKDFSDLLRYLSEHVHDHLAAGEANLRAATIRERPPFLEHSVYVNGLSPESIDQIGELARTLWKPTFKHLVDVARERFELDAPRALPGRLRVGIYVYSETPGSRRAGPKRPAAGKAAASQPAAEKPVPTRPARTRRPGGSA